MEMYSKNIYKILLHKNRKRLIFEISTTRRAFIRSSIHFILHYYTITSCFHHILHPFLPACTYHTVSPCINIIVPTLHCVLTAPFSHHITSAQQLAATIPPTSLTCKYLHSLPRAHAALHWPHGVPTTLCIFKIMDQYTTSWTNTLSHSAHLTSCGHNTSSVHIIHSYTFHVGPTTLHRHHRTPTTMHSPHCAAVTPCIYTTLPCTHHTLHPSGWHRSQRDATTAMVVHPSHPAVIGVVSAQA